MAENTQGEPTEKPKEERVIRAVFKGELTIEGGDTCTCSCSCSCYGSENYSSQVASTSADTASSNIA